jgi:glycosyltransferase involved in cell wall biosynthesis
VRAVLLTEGDPDAPTGGSRFHRAIAERSPELGVDLELRSLAPGDDPPSLVGRAEVAVVDSIVAARIRPRDLGVPVVSSVMQLPGGLVGSPAARARRAILDVRCYRSSATVVAPSPYVRRALARLGVDRRRIVVVAPGSGVPVVASAALASRRTGVRFLCVANLAAHKRPLDVLDAFAIAGVEGSVTLVGDSVDPRVTTAVRERIRAWDHVRQRATWTGVLPPARVARALGEADVFVFPALHESYAMALADAMRAGLPSIVARSGNAPALVRDGVDGFVVPPRRVEALAAAMRRLAEDDGLRAEMSRSAHLRARAFPSWDEAASRFANVLERVARQPTAPPFAPAHAAPA